MRAPFRARPRPPVRRPPGAEAPDPRIWGRHYTGPAPWVLGVAVAVVLAILGYLAFAKQLPWATDGYTITATFESTATLREDAPVRIAGVEVGEVVAIERRGDTAAVTFTVDQAGRPVRADAEVEIRPRLFLEGNFFLDLDPGSPGAPELDDGGEIPVTQTAIAVQLDEILTALERPQRRGLRRLLEGFGTALTYRPAPPDDLTQDPDVRGESAAESLNDAFRYGGRAGRDTAIVADALRGRRPHDLSGLIASSGRMFAELGTVETELADLVTNFNVTLGALASESESLSETIAQLGPTLGEAEISLRDLSDALPPLRALARESRPAIQELPATIAAFTPWLAETELLLRNRELGGVARLLREQAPGLARTAAASRRLFPALGAVGRCATENLVPTADTAITAGGFATGQPNFREFLYAAVQLAGSGQPFDGNGPYLRLQPAGGPELVSVVNPGGGFEDTRAFGSAVDAPAGIQPVLPSSPPPFRPDVPCHTNPVPNLNGPAAAAGPPDLVGAP